MLGPQEAGEAVSLVEVDSLAAEEESVVFSELLSVELAAAFFSSECPFDPLLPDLLA